ncbi:hypothetical protein BDP27DRAFT_1309623 [Rhodocollybia butyracea]|uniref:BTB domain-containing protein n=1 Tax=Rhodocollybia butyracea TaxID=206335 RepID=A0A9P5UH32_9AGAR|nr:hypothetical protein BDP27DRAFT_1309623 [Rhodocollybia butyracea]
MASKPKLTTTTTATITGTLRAPSLQESIDLSTESWQRDLASLFRNAKECFADVVWEVGPNLDGKGEIEEVWGHKAIVYARAPPSFQTRYFQFRPNTSSLSPSQSPIPGASALSLNLGLELSPHVSRSPSPLSRGSPVSTNTTKDGITRLQTTITPALFSNELEYLYTGQGFGEAFEFLFDSNNLTGGLDGMGSEAEAQEVRLDKLRKDLVFMWRSRLYSDIKVSLTVTGNFSTSSTGDKEHENTTAVFSTHRFVLVSRSAYFRNLLLPNPAPSLGKTLSSSLTSTSPLTLTLPSPPFTPASLHFTLGYLYTGTLAFSHRTYDLTTALHIYLSALPAHLHLPHLLDEIRGRIIVELCHGLFHAFLDFPSYDAVTKGRWGASSGGVGGCICRQCARRAPRILEFAVRSEVADPYLDRGARRALVGLLGDGWVTSEWAGLEGRLRESVLKGVKKRMMPLEGNEQNSNVWSMLFAIESALTGRLSKAIKNMEKEKGRFERDSSATMTDTRPDSNWLEIVRADLLRARDAIDECLADRVTECFTPPPPAYPQEDESSFVSEWHEILLRALPAAHASSYQRHRGHHKLASIVSSLTPSSLTPSYVSDADVAIPIDNNKALHVSVASQYEDAHRVSIILASLLRGLKPINAPLVYQTLVSNILLLPASPHAQDNSADISHSMSIYDIEDEYGNTLGAGTLLPATSHVRVQVEEARMGVLRWIRDKGRWSEVRDQGGFDKDGAMEGWAVKEIADYLQMSVDELTPSANPTTPHSLSRNLKPRPDTDSASIHSTNSLSPSMRVSILSRNLPQKSSGLSHRSDTGGLKSSASSIRSVRSTNTARRRVEKILEERPDSKLTPSDVNVPANLEDDDDGTLDGANSGENGKDEDISMKSTPSRSSSTTPGSPRSPRSRVVSPSPSGVSLAKKASNPKSTPTTPSIPGRRLASNTSLASSRSSVASMSSATSSISPRAAAARPTVSPHGRPPRPRSAASTRSTMSTRSTVSTTSTVRRNAAASQTKGGLQVPPVPLPRPISASTSGTSTTSGTSDFRTAPSSGTPRQRTMSAASTGSTKSAISTRSARSSVTNATAGGSTGPRSNKPTTKRPPSVAGSIKSVKSVSGKSTGVSPADKARAQAKAAAITTRGTKSVSKKASTDTIKGERASKSDLTPPVPPIPTTSPPSVPDPGLSEPSEEDTSPYPTHLGSTLSIGIPCIVSSKRRRFRALARYIGEVEGELGPWVGVEVPINDVDKEKDVVMEDVRPWHDGTWRGIRYFDVSKGPGSNNGGASGEEWGDSMDDSRTLKRRGAKENPSAYSYNSYNKGTKRRVDQWSGDSQSTSRYGTYGVGSSKRMRMGMMARSASPSMSDGGQVGGTESRGLFVRPQQVLYVVDAIDGDL